MKKILQLTNLIKAYILKRKNIKDIESKTNKKLSLAEKLEIIGVLHLD